MQKEMDTAAREIRRTLNTKNRSPFSQLKKVARRKALVLLESPVRNCAGLLCLFLALTGTRITALAQQSPPAKELVSITVTVTGRDSRARPALAREDIIVRQDGERRPVVAWVPAQGKHVGLDLAILVDDSLDTSFGTQLPDLSEFIRGLPSTTRVAVFYGSHGGASLIQGFTPDHEQAIKALRLPVGEVNEISSIYLAVTDLVKKWPTSENRGGILLISDGIDLFRGVADSAPGMNGDLQEAIDQAQRRGIPVYTLFASGASRFHRNFFLISNGQGCLARLAYETGGEAFFQGFQTPVAFRPFLQDLASVLGRQYLLTFRAHLGKKAGYASLHVTTEQPGVELAAPSRIYIPAVE